MPIGATLSSARATPGSPLTLTIVAPPGSGGGTTGPSDTRHKVVITMDLGVPIRSSDGSAGGKLSLDVSVSH